MAVSRPTQPSSIDQEPLNEQPDLDTTFVPLNPFEQTENGYAPSGNSTEATPVAPSDILEDDEDSLGDFPYANGFYGELPLAEITTKEQLSLPDEDLPALTAD